MNPYTALRNYFIGQERDAGTDVFVRARYKLLFDFSLFLLITIIPFQLTLWFENYLIQFYINWFPTVLILFVFYFLKKRQLFWAGIIYCIVQFGNSYAHAVVYNFRPSMQGCFWILLGVLVAFFIIGNRAGVIASFLLIFYLIFSIINYESGYHYFNAGFSENEALPEKPLFVITPLFLNLYMIWLMMRIQKKAESELLLAYKNNEDLLLNILPQETAEELKSKGSADAKLYDDVTILFADIKSFSKISENLPPQELVNELHENFKAFDEIITRYGIEKIKTIGDAYLCICGAPNQDPDHAKKMVSAAKEFLEVSGSLRHSREDSGKTGFDFRIGIHSGSIVAGVVGIKKFAYDIWGDAVNTAARMEQNGEPGRINISESTYQLVRHSYPCTYRGEIDAKNKGMLKMYFVD